MWSPQQSRRRPRVPAAVALLVGVVVGSLALSGCALDLFADPGTEPQSAPSASPLGTDEPSSSATPVDGLQEFYDQDVSWERCREGMECATMRVPLDYEDPEGESIELALLRVPATQSDRLGSLVVNPGGPGGSGVDFAARAPSRFGRALRRSFDIVGFDPRGVGRSTPLDCVSDQVLDDFVAADPDPDNPEELAEADRMIARFGQGCLDESGALARHMSTVEAARDVDVLRAVLGDRRLSWFGASYGTLLGATYAELFPERVGRMVLDGAIDPTLSERDTSLVQAEGFETALRAYVDNCVTRGGCFLGGTVDAGTVRIRTFLDRVERQPLPAGDRRLEVGNAVLGIWAPLYNRGYWPLLDASLQQAFAGQGTALMSLSDAYTSRGPDGYSDNSLEALYAVNCLDQADPLDSAEVLALVPEYEKVSPTFGRIFATGLSACSQWPVQSGTPTPQIDAEGAAPILVVGTSRDPATPLVWAEALAEQLDSGVLVRRDGDGHTGYMAGNACVDRTIERYLVSGAVPSATVDC